MAQSNVPQTYDHTMSSIWLITAPINFYEFRIFRTMVQSRWKQKIHFASVAIASASI